MANYAYNLTKRVNRLKAISNTTSSVGGKISYTEPTQAQGGEEGAFLYSISGLHNTNELQKISYASVAENDVFFFDELGITLCRLQNIDVIWEVL